MFTSIRDFYCLHISIVAQVLHRLHFVEQNLSILFSTPFIVHEMYSVQCDVRFVNLLLYMDTFC